MQATAFETSDNHLLAALPPQDRERWQSCLEVVVLAQGQVLQDTRRPPRYAYFPIGAVVSLQIDSEDGHCDEVGLVGREGMVGVSTFTGSGPSSTRAVVQNPGRALRLSAERIRSELAASTGVLRLLLRYMLSQAGRVAQGVVCGRHHTVAQRLSLRLLLGMEHQPGSRLSMTHQQLSGWLGVRRESVTEESVKLHKAGLIAYARGHITVLDRAGLAQRSCECFALLTSEDERVGACATAGQPLGWDGPYRSASPTGEKRGVPRAPSA